MQGPTKPWENLRRERQLEGIAKAKAAGVYKGRPPCLVPAPKGHCSHCCCVDQPVSVVLDLMHPTRSGGRAAAASVPSICGDHLQRGACGSSDVSQGIGAIRAAADAAHGLAIHEPKTAAALFARVLPYFVNIGGEVPDVVSEAEMEAMLKELGLPPGLIEHMQSAPAPRDLDEDLDPYGMHAEAAAKGATDAAAE